MLDIWGHERHCVCYPLCSNLRMKTLVPPLVLASQNLRLWALSGRSKENRSISGRKRVSKSIRLVSAVALIDYFYDRVQIR
jgi:hypothetical protein